MTISEASLPRSKVFLQSLLKTVRACLEKPTLTQESMRTTPPRKKTISFCETVRPIPTHTSRSISKQKSSTKNRLQQKEPVVAFIRANDTSRVCPQQRSKRRPQSLTRGRSTKTWSATMQDKLKDLRMSSTGYRRTSGTNRQASLKLKMNRL